MNETRCARRREPMHIGTVESQFRLGFGGGGGANYERASSESVPHAWAGSSN